MPNRKKLTHKKSKPRGGRKVNKKKTASKNRKKSSKQLKPESIGKILSDVHILLSFPSIEFLPSTNIFNKGNDDKDKTGHYLQMIDYQDLANMINKNPHYKKSPTIQSIFNYKSYKLEDEGEIIFNYKNIKCDNLILKEQKDYNVKVLFLHLLECNIEERLKEIIQFGGDTNYNLEDMLMYDMNKEGDENDDQGANENQNDNNNDEEKMQKELEHVREIERERIMERRRLERELIEKEEQQQKENRLNEEQKFEKEIEEQRNRTDEDKLNIERTPIHKELSEEKELLNDIKQYKDELSKQKEEINEKVEEEVKSEMIQEKLFEEKMNEEEKKVKEKAMEERMNMEKMIEMKVKGFESYLENRKISNLSKNSFAIYNVNWFNVCCGIEKYDNTYEETIQQQISDMGLIINEEDIVNNLLKLFEDKGELSKFKKMIKNRLISCSEIDPPSFFDKLFTDSFGTMKQCDERSPQSILYLYDGYKRFIERDIPELSKLDKVLILIYCETRQHNLSKYISLEILRKDNDKKKKLKSILDKIMQSDKKIIQKNDKILEEQEKLKYDKIKEKRIKEETKKNNMKTLINKNNIIIQKNKIKDLEEEHVVDPKEEYKKQGKGFFDKLLNLFEDNAESPTFDIRLTPKERETYQRVIDKMKGGGSISYESTEKEKNETCNKIKNENNIYKNQLSMVNHC